MGFLIKLIYIYSCLTAANLKFNTLFDVGFVWFFVENNNKENQDSSADQKNVMQEQRSDMEYFQCLIQSGKQKHFLLIVLLDKI